jgi:hypothetical protein
LKPFTATLCALATLIGPLHHLVAPAPAQPAPGDKPAARPGGVTRLPGYTLGQRARLARTLDTRPSAIVIATDQAGALDAIATLWNPAGPAASAGPVPILLDDGTPGAREDIARFVRAWADDTTSPPTAPPPLLRWRVPEQRAQASAGLDRAGALHAAVRAAWNARDDKALLEAWNARDVQNPGPVGVVVTAPDDPGALAAGALAAFYGQLLVLVEPPAQVADEWTVPKVDALSRQVIGALDARGLKHGALGDTIDALTLCLQAGAKVRVQDADRLTGQQPMVCRPGEYIALTDLLGRPMTGDRAGRWAYAGHITGTPSRALYRAMCAIFLRTQRARALLVDTYQSGPGWDAFDAQATAKQMAPPWLAPAVMDGREVGLDEWRTVLAGAMAPRVVTPALPGSTPPVRGGLDVGTVIFTTMGNWDAFALRPGSGTPGDIPLLHQPAMVYFVHSWSLQFGDQANTVGGRWQDLGAYAYVGSVHEPFLPAFVPPAMTAAMLRDGLALGAAVRHDTPPLSLPWRVGLMGCPLITLGTGAQGQSLGPAKPWPDLTDAAPVQAELRPALAAKDFTLAAHLLVLQGRDADLVRLLQAMRADPATRDSVTPELAAIGALAAYRRADLDLLVDLAGLAGDLPASNQWALADALWHTLGPRRASLTPAQAQMLARNVRPWNLLRDTGEAARAIKSLPPPSGGPEAAGALFDRAIGATQRPEIKKQLQELRPQVLGGR